MSDRLEELRRQRALVQEHLAWLEREISAATPASAVSPEAKSQAAATGAAKVGALSLAASTPTPPLSKPPASSVAPAGAASVDPSDPEIPAEYQITPGTLHADVRKGCLLYFVAAFAAVILGVALLYIAFRR